jgi:bifunctional non-homologous end joining protein LigD
LFTANASKESRKGRIYIDYLRNARGASAIASYSLRAKLGFPVATPIAWSELRTLSSGAAFTRVNLFKRLESLVGDPWDKLESAASTLTPQVRRDVRMKS